MSVENKLDKIFAMKRKREILPIIHEVNSCELLKGKNALISGGTGGIGLAIAEELVKSGANVVVGGTKHNKLKQSVEYLNNIKADCAKYVKFDMSNSDLFDSILKDAIACFGRIDIFVNAAGVHTENASIDKMNSDEVDRILNINLKGPYLFSIKLREYMIENRIKGHMLFISSSREFEPAWSPYGISKWGLNGMIQGLASIFVEDGIIVNGLAPGTTATGLIGYHNGESIYTEDNMLKRLALPIEIATIAKMMVSGVGDFIVGEVVRVSAGRGIIDIRS
jgi:NAD(P)-dependent dehydrogenase (short-subunit alcohol dehydrogenase family)